MRITLTWLDGTSTTGASWEDVESSVRAAQWVEYQTQHDFRTDLRHRCKVWTGVRPNLTHASSENFLRALETSGLCRIDLEDQSTDDDDQKDLL